MIRILALSVLLWVASGCRAQESQQPVESERSKDLQQMLTHRSVAPPPAVTGQQPVLWVSLGAHLGGRADGSPLTLTAASGNLSLKDRSGRQWSAASVQISWRSVPLETPLALARQVAGPFASFESAERVALRWRALGVAAEVAHPADWEVWAPAGAAVPADLTARDLTTLLDSSVEPLLQLPEGGQTLKGPLEINAPGGLRWGKGVFQGPFRLQRDAYGSWTLVEQVPFERYLEGVVPHEIGAGSPPAALEAQTVLARTWALANRHRFRIDGYHLCSDTQCQVYSDPRQAGPAVRQAITATQGRLLSWQDKPISAVYHASNGGVMAAGPEAWAMDAQPYLRAEADGDAVWRQRHGLPLDQRSAVASLLAQRQGAYGSAHPRFRWTRTLTATGIRQALGASADGLKGPLQLDVLERGRSGRVLALQVSGTEGGAPVVLKLDRIRRTIRRLPSTLFVIEPQGDQRWLVRGGGFGHGAGLSQAGAIDLAWRGWSTERILAHYYPGTVYGPLLPPLESP